MGINFVMVDENVWGYRAQPIHADEIVDRLKDEVSQGILGYQILPEEPEECRDKAGYKRVSVNIPVSAILYDQFFNGCSGYRAQYFIGIENGEFFNRLLVDIISPIIVNAENLYSDKFTRAFCDQSLCGRFSKFWFSREITDPSGQAYLDKLPEVISVDRWKNHWEHGLDPTRAY